jgi:hypothetical protein
MILRPPAFPSAQESVSTGATDALTADASPGSERLASAFVAGAVSEGSERAGHKVDDPVNLKGLADEE